MFVFWNRSIKIYLRYTNSFEKNINSFEKKNINSIVWKQKKIQQFNWEKYQQFIWEKYQFYCWKQKKNTTFTLRKISNLEKRKKWRYEVNFMKYSTSMMHSMQCNIQFNETFNSMKYLIQCDQINNNYVAKRVESNRVLKTLIRFISNWVINESS